MTGAHASAASHRRRRARACVVVTSIALAISACGGGGTKEAASTSATTVADTGGADTGGTAAPATRRPRPRPVIDPNDPASNLTRALDRLVLAGRCQEAIGQATQAINGGGNQDDVATGFLYRGIAEGCVKATRAVISNDLGQARSRQGRLVIDSTGPNRCFQTELLSWAFAEFLGTDVAVPCPSPTTSAPSTRGSTTTSTRSTTTTTRR